MSSDVAIRVSNLSKCYQIYDKPRDRLKQAIMPKLYRAASPLLKNFSSPPSYFREFWALRDVSFEVKKGETVGIIGRNGSGKSTLLQMICGTLSPTAGDVQLNGRVAALLELGAGFNPEFTGKENVYMNGAVLGLSREEIDERFVEIAAFADIDDFIDQPVKTYSSGMYVRLAFAVQACIEPKILIVDEALSVGDEKFQRKCFDYIDHLRLNGTSILLVTHSTATIEKFCQRAALLNKGKMHGFGSAKEIVDQYHALLYSDEKAYLRYLNNHKVTVESKSVAENSTTKEIFEGESFNKKTGNHTENPGLRAIIKTWEVLDLYGEYCEVFRPGDDVMVRFCVDLLEPIREIQAGILIRTVEGVSAFGTSTFYHDKNYLNGKAGTTVKFEFRLKLSLCQGTYFVTLAIAEAISHCDMTYLDRKTDVIILKIGEARILGSGIAALRSSVSVNEVRKGIHEVDSHCYRNI